MLWNIMTQKLDVWKCPENRPAYRKRHRPNTFGIKMTFLLLNKLMITATHANNTAITVHVQTARQHDFDYLISK